MDIYIRQFYSIYLNTFNSVYVFIVSVYICIFLLFSRKKPIYTNSMEYFFPVDSTAHDFMFNLTPCSIVNKSVWKAALMWIPSESLLTRQLYSSNAKKRIQAKS